MEICEQIVRLEQETFCLLFVETMCYGMVWCDMAWYGMVIGGVWF